MAKITGLGGVFYMVEDPEATRAWYREKLGWMATMARSWRGARNPSATPIR